MYRTNVRASVAALACMLASCLLIFSCSRQPVHAAPPVKDGYVVIDAASLAPEVPRFFTYDVGGRPVSFFAIRMPNGVHSYLDACVTCYPQKRGYGYADGRVICRACNMEFSVYKLEKGVGGCYPIKLPGETVGTTYRIPVAALVAEAGKF